MTSDGRPDRILLIGMMGAGKTTVGHALSARLGWPYLDNDELLARNEHASTRELHERQGVEALRVAESEALATALTLDGPLIAGVAGGTVLDAGNRARLTAAFTVWLRVDIEVLVQRVSGTDRPWLGESPAEAMRTLYAGREPLYAEVAAMTVDAGAQSPQQVAELVAQRIGA